MSRRTGVSGFSIKLKADSSVTLALPHNVTTYSIFRVQYTAEGGLVDHLKYFPDDVSP